MNKIRLYLQFLSQQKHPLRTILATLLLKTKLHKLFKIHLRGYKLYFPNAVGDNGRVYAFEPHPKIFHFLSSNITLNNYKNVQLFNIALGDKPGSCKFSNDQADDRNHPDEHGKITVEVDTLDKMLIHIEKIELLKIDVEGYEKFVLEGGKSVLSRTQSIYFEVCENFTQRFGYSALDLIYLIHQSGFNLFTLDNQLHPEPLSANFRADPNKVIDILGVRDLSKLKSRLKLQKV